MKGSSRRNALKWHDQRWVRSYEQAVARARASGCVLVVTVLRDGRTTGRVERKRPSDGGWETIGQREWKRSTDAVLLRARAWCEITAANAK